MSSSLFSLTFSRARFSKVLRGSKAPGDGLDDEAIIHRDDDWANCSLTKRSVSLRDLLVSCYSRSTVNNSRELCRYFNDDMKNVGGSIARGISIPLRHRVCTCVYYVPNHFPATTTMASA